VLVGAFAEMSDWLDSQKQSISSIRQLLQEHMEIIKK